MGSLGWAIGDRSPHSAQQHRQDTRFPTSVIQAGKPSIAADMLNGWMLRGDTPYLIIDTRPASDYSELHLLRAINRDIDTLLSLQSLRRLPHHKPIILYGTSERDNAAAVVVLRMTGLSAFYLTGSKDKWVALPTSGTNDSEVATLAALQQQPQQGHNSARQHTSPKPPNHVAGADADTQKNLQLGMLDD